MDSYNPIIFGFALAILSLISLKVFYEFLRWEIKDIVEKTIKDDYLINPELEGEISKRLSKYLDEKKVK